MVPQKQVGDHTQPRASQAGIPVPQQQWGLQGHPQNPSLLLPLGFASSELYFSASMSPWLHRHQRCH